MIKRISVGWRLSISTISVVLLSSHAAAATPEQIVRGQQLFTQEFASTPLGENGDGLGPVFNHTSCVACHRAGGVGGGGDHRFNARTFSISSMTFDQRASQQPLVDVFKAVAPGFVTANDQIVNTAPMHRRGGSSEFDQLRQQTMARFNPHWLDDASVNSDAVHAEASPQAIVDANGTLAMTGHIFARNTTALFGAGLIDMVPDSVIREQFKAQQRHPEIHGRPATLSDGRIGKFGWRANFATLLEFTENACVNELGLQSKAVPQPKDMTKPAYVNTQIDIDNDSIIAMKAFIAALPSPTRSAAEDSQHREEILKGEARFQAVGCAVCHVPNLGPAKELFSDLLLHDMGPYSLDLNPAPPYLRNTEIEMTLVHQSRNATTTTTMDTTGQYYGGVSQMTSNTSSRYDIRDDRRGSSTFASARREFRFEAPQRPPRSIRTPLVNAIPVVLESKKTVTKETASATSTSDIEETRAFQPSLRSDTIPTNFNQEWRTAPLWGLSDSAPYMHDGRAETVLEAIAMHAGESEKTRNRFFALPYEDQQAVLTFLDTLVAPQSGVIPVEKDFVRRDLAVK